MLYANYISIKKESPWLVCLSGLSIFPIRAHACIAGQVPSRGHVRGNRTLFLSLSFFLPSPLKINNLFFKKKERMNKRNKERKKIRRNKRFSFV